MWNLILEEIINKVKISVLFLNEGKIKLENVQISVNYCNLLSFVKYRNVIYMQFRTQSEIRCYETKRQSHV